MTDLGNNKKIAKNTLLLYFRMFLVTGVSLYTSRIVLNTLGIEDFGIYNIVGGLVLSLSFLSASLSLSTNRFLSFELGKKDDEKFKKVFSMSINIHVIIAIVAFFLAETIGLWFLNAKLNIPENRMNAANWVYQFSLLTFVFTIIGVPYNAIFVAHEKMKVYAYISMLEVSLKLAIVFLLIYGGFDKLKLYSVLVCFVSLIIWSTYRIYVKKSFPESKYIFAWDKSLFKEMLNYAGWNLLTYFGKVTKEQGVNITLNIFFGTVINAAMGIVNQVNLNINAFVFNFQMALYPQIIKSYAAKNIHYMHQLIFQGAKYSFFLLYFISLPLILVTETVLTWWLKIVPEHTVLFCRLVLINTMIESISGTLSTASEASGKIKVYQTAVGLILFITLPITYVLLKMGMPAYSTFIVSISLSLGGLFIRLNIVKSLVDLSVASFLQKVLFKILLVVSVSIIFPLLVKMAVVQPVLQFLAVGITSVLSIGITIYLIGLNSQEKGFVFERIIQLKNRFFKKKV